MSEWQPIETAPKDEGSVVILWDGEVIMGELRDGRFRVFLDGQTIWTPSHWMPLPAPPEPYPMLGTTRGNK